LLPSYFQAIVSAALGMSPVDVGSVVEHDGSGGDLRNDQPLDSDLSEVMVVELAVYQPVGRTGLSTNRLRNGLDTAGLRVGDVLDVPVPTMGDAVVSVYVVAVELVGLVEAPIPCPDSSIGAGNVR
jgi:hypothetical protein